MDPVTATAVTTAVAAAATATTQIMSSNAQSASAKTQGQWAERQAMEDRAVAQRQAGEETRKKQLAQSRLMSVAGASGSGASDPTVMKLMGDIEKEGQYNASATQSDGDRRAAGTTYQAALDRWSAKETSRVSKISAAGTLIGGMGDAYGKYKSPMARRYGSRASSGTGYGGA